MSQQSISEILKHYSPNWLTQEEIVRHSKLSMQSVNRALNSLKKRDEVEVKLLPGKQRRLKTLYRIQLEESKW